MEKSKEKKSLEPWSIKKLDSLRRIRLFVVSIFAFSTLSIVLVFIPIDFRAPVIFILISYVLVFILMIRLFTIREL
jgi:hypothetical protein